MSHPFQEAFSDPVLCLYMFLSQFILLFSVVTINFLITETVLFIFILAIGVPLTLLE